MMKVGITGGIGSGKSTVCRLFAARGVAVYDSDTEARRLMQEDAGLRARIADRFGAEAYRRDGTLDRKYLAGRVFGDPAALSALNGLVHPAVIAAFEAWAARQTGDYVVLESAVLSEAGRERKVDRAVAVLAPPDRCVEGTCRRDGCTPEEVRRRIAAQLDDDTLCARADCTIVNIRESELAPAVEELDRRFRHEAHMPRA